MVAASIAAAGLLGSLRPFRPMFQQIEHIPDVIDSDWLNTVLMTPVAYLCIKGAALLIRRAFGRDPFEAFAATLDRTAGAPSLTKHFERRMAGYPAEVLDYRMRIVTGRELDLLSQLNREVFGRTAFSLPLDVIKRRNRSLFEANPLVFAFIEARIGSGYVPIGMSNILPLNAIGDSLYCRTGGLRDSQLRGVHVAGVGEWPESVLLFSMGILRSFRGRLADSPLTLGNVFVDHLAEIVAATRSRQVGESQLRVLAQTEYPRGGIGKLLQRCGFTDSGIVTGDGYPLWEIRGAVPSATPPSATALALFIRSLTSLSTGRRPLPRS
ncbi:hypothetical protein [Nocardia stercoris]|uniref:hypothetical protein n=1 Tax=Nocardia stercoris TaxID=2483361 RepID=UPI0011C344A8|nr:hypothetical protein [Nocardia stercoris]